ncbi:hypothetical protein MGYG_01971 [Nannizzia gypsea CBS 118893]|uniref:Uncharacterized protein n=1 Tax=Arthroderma gypseum (strain ATCC MYA-4604 / CBS 118893) TaxID=535722 RepID=E5QZ50_ARTGP|nr:hypothetical protein MGYG_01971 [Nannizzia gypsea CBS 118893]EFQ98959.1 hypothetical protein MGYG_01971 [Nannizzia gypsea CBS 118893]
MNCGSSPDKLGKNARYQRQPRHKTREDRYEPRTTARRPRKTHRQVKRLASDRKLGNTAIKDNFKPPNISQTRLTLNATAGGLFRHGRASSPVIRSEQQRNSLHQSQQNTISKYFSPSRSANPQCATRAHLENPRDLELAKPTGTTRRLLSRVDAGHSASPSCSSWSKARSHYPNPSKKRTLSEIEGSVADSGRSTTYYTWSRTNSKLSSSDPKGSHRTDHISEKPSRPISAGSSQLDSRVQNMLFHNAYIAGPLEQSGKRAQKPYSLEGLLQKAAETSPYCSRDDFAPSLKKLDTKRQGNLSQKSNRPWPSVKDIPRPVIYDCPPGYDYDTSHLAKSHSEYYHTVRGFYPPGHETWKDVIPRSLNQGSQRWFPCQSSSLAYDAGPHTPQKGPTSELPSDTPLFNRQYRLYGSPPPFNLINYPRSKLTDLDVQYSRVESPEPLHLLDDEAQTLRTPSEPDGYLLYTSPSRVVTPYLQSKEQAAPGDQNIETDQQNVRSPCFWRPNKLY